MNGAARILTIEDEPEIRDGIVTYLEDSGFDMLQAGDGESGLNLFREQRPDAVLCDLRLPGMDGLEVLSTIGRESPETPVIIVSGMGLLDFAVQALKRGAWDYVVKPIADMDVVENALNRVLERARLLKENREYQQQLETMNRELSDALGQLQADEEAGRHIQSQLLPKDKRELQGYLFRHRLYPSMYLSGDFLDYFPVNDHYIGFYIADVSGHDAAAAFVTVMLKMFIGQLRGLYQEAGDSTILSPACTLNAINQFILDQRLGKYLTMFYGVIDTRDDCMLYSQGGHFPHPILYDGEQAVPLAVRSKPVGLFANTRYQEHYRQLQEDFVLLCASDGILELLPQSSLAEKCEALRAQVNSACCGIDSLVERLDLARASQLPDDVTLLEIRRNPPHG